MKKKASKIKLRKFKNWQKAVENKQKLTIKQVKQRRDHYLLYATTQCNKYCKVRDFAGQDRIKCITCDRMITYSESNACHFITCACWLYRFDEKNIHTGCVFCNCYDKQNHQQNYTILMIKQYGMAMIEEMKRQKNLPHKKPDWEELKNIGTYFEEKINNVNI